MYDHKLRATASWSGCKRRAAAEVDAAAEESWLARLGMAMRDEDWPCKTSSHQRRYHIRLMVCQNRGLCWTHTVVVKEVRYLYAFSEESCWSLHYANVNRGESSTDLGTTRELCRHRTAHTGWGGSSWSKQSYLYALGFWKCLALRWESLDLWLAKHPLYWSQNVPFALWLFTNHLKYLNWQQLMFR